MWNLKLSINTWGLDSDLTNYFPRQPRTRCCGWSGILFRMIICFAMARMFIFKPDMSCRGHVDNLSDCRGSCFLISLFFLPRAPLTRCCSLIRGFDSPVRSPSISVQHAILLWIKQRENWRPCASKLDAKCITVKRQAPATAAVLYFPLSHAYCNRCNFDSTNLCCGNTTRHQSIVFLCSTAVALVFFKSKISGQKTESLLKIQKWLRKTFLITLTFYHTKRDDTRLLVWHPFPGFVVCFDARLCGSDKKSFCFPTGCTCRPSRGSGAMLLGPQFGSPVWRVPLLASPTRIHFCHSGGDQGALQDTGERTNKYFTVGAKMSTGCPWTHWQAEFFIRPDLKNKI